MAKSSSFTAEGTSEVVSLLTTAGLIAWVVTTHARGLDGTPIPLPTYWMTGSAPVWAALLVLGVQTMLLVSSALKATKKEEIGMLDMAISIMTWAVTLVIVVLLAVGQINYSANLINGVAAFMFANTVEMAATIGVWMVANRKPGGVIGGVASA